MPEPRPEFHLHDDFSLTPAYVLGYAFNALGRIEATTPVRGSRGAIALLTELLATMAALELDTGLTAAEPLRTEQEVLIRNAEFGPDWPGFRRTDPCGARCRRRGGACGTSYAGGRCATRTRPPGSPSVRVLLGDAGVRSMPGRAPGRCVGCVPCARRPPVHGIRLSPSSRVGPASGSCAELPIRGGLSSRTRAWTRRCTAAGPTRQAFLGRCE